jgi:hypothetical protein
VSDPHFENRLLRIPPDYASTWGAEGVRREHALDAILKHDVRDHFAFKDIQADVFARRIDCRRVRR